MRRLATIPGVGAITAATIVALVPDPKAFTSAGILPRGSATKNAFDGRQGSVGEDVKNGKHRVAIFAAGRHDRDMCTCAPWRNSITLVD
jgi:transposase